MSLKTCSIQYYFYIMYKLMICEFLFHVHKRCLARSFGVSTCINGVEMIPGGCFRIYSRKRFQISIFLFFIAIMELSM